MALKVKGSSRARKSNGSELSLFNDQLQLIIEYAVEKAVVKVKSLEIPDLDHMSVDEIIAWSERTVHTPGLLNSPRRRACGMELIRKGVALLLGQLPPPNDRRSPLKAYAVQ